MNPTIRYHLKELQIAKTPRHPKYVMPNFTENDRRVLDLGCGIGQTLVAADLGNNRFQTGIDIDFESLSYGKKRYGNINFVNGSGERLPFKDGVFDFVISRVSLPYTNINESARDISRVLKDNGKIWLVLHPVSMTIKNFIMSIVHFRIKGIISQIYVLLNGAALHFFQWQFPFPVIQRYESFQTKSGIRKVLKANGFKNIHISQDNHFIVSANVHKPSSARYNDSYS